MKPEIPEIRIATTADINIIRQLTDQIWPPTYVPIIGEGQVAYMLNLFYTPEALQQQMAAGHRFIICYLEGKPVAFASYSAVEPGIFKLHKIYLLPELQGKGIGKLMLNYIKEDAKKEGGHVLRLNVNIHNHSAKAFYSKVGFTHYRDEDIDIGGGYFMNDHVLTMAL